MVERLCSLQAALIMLLLPAAFSAAQTQEDWDRQAKTILGNAGVEGGLIVHVNCGDGRLAAALKTSDSMVVHGLDADATVVARARSCLRTAGYGEAVTVDTFDGEHLPYTDDLVNLLVVSCPSTVSAKEMSRVLSPGGVAYILNGDKHRKLEKPWPDNIDEWTHYLHSPGNNAVAQDTAVGPPRHMQWLGGPRWSRNHHKLCSISSVVTTGGRLFYIMDEAPAANITLPGEWSIVARDAFNGVELWRKPMESWVAHEIRFRSGPAQVTRLLVADGDVVYAPLALNAPVSALDGATGKTLRTYGATNGAEEIVCVNGVLVVLTGAPVAEHAFKHGAFAGRYRAPNEKVIVAVQAKTEEELWRWADPEMHLMPETLASDGERVYVQAGEGILCFDLKSGERLWTAGEPKKGGARKRISFGRNTLVVVDNVVLCNLSGRLTAFAGDSGKLLWDCEGGAGFHSPADVFVIDGLVWRGSHVHDSVSPPPVNDFSEGRDLRTGKVKVTNTVMVDLQTAGHHHRCYREKATLRYILAGKRGIEMMDLAENNHSRNNWVRGTCQYGILPANGLIYAPPHACGCYMESKLWGFWALAAEKEEWPEVSDNTRLEKGPAYSRCENKPLNLRGSWPQYRHDALRSGVADRAVKGDLQRHWKVSLGGDLTPPVIAQGKVLVADKKGNTVYALDEGSGEVVWRYVAGAAVDSPPSIYRGMALFGSADGRVYCVRLSDGALVWRFLAARADVRTVAQNRVESLWPVHGSVLILNDVAYCSAGRSTWLDGGIDLYALDPVSGEIMSKTHFKSRHPEYCEGKDKAQPEHAARIDQNVTDYKTFEESDLSDAFSMAAGAVSDVLVSDGSDVFLHHVCFDSKLNRRNQLRRHLFSTSSLLDGAENHRSHWVLGTGDFSRVPVAYSWIVNRPDSRNPTIAVPTGVMMVYDESGVWGVRRQGNSNGKYSLFRKQNEPFKQSEESLADFRKLSRDEVDPCVWKHDLPVRTRAMVKAGTHLLLGVVPLGSSPEDVENAYTNSAAGQIRIVHCDDGKQIAEYGMASAPVWDGMAAADGKVFVSMLDGSVVCWTAAGQGTAQSQ